MSKKPKTFSDWVKVLSLFVLADYFCGCTVPANIACNYGDKSPGTILRTSPELFYSDVLYFVPDNNLESSCWEIASTNQISIFDATFNDEEKQIHLQHFLPSVIYLSSGNITEIVDMLELFTTVSESYPVVFPIFKNGYPNLRLHTIIDLSDNVIEEMESEIRNFTFKFQLNNRLHVLTKSKTEYNSTSQDIMNEIYAIKDINFIETLPVEIYSITNPTHYIKYNFQEAVIRATAVDSNENDPVVTYDADSQTDKFVYGLGVFEFWDLRDMLNFSVQAMKGDDDISANKSNDFKPMGIGLQLFMDEADVSILHSYHLVDNVKHLKPLFALGEDRVYAIFRQPPSFSVRNVFVKPFKNDVWIGIFLMWTVIALCVFFFVYWLKLCPQFGEHWDVDDTVLWIVSAIAQRSFFKSPGSISLKLLFVFGLCFSMTTYISYSAEIISFLTAEIQPINSLTDLISNGFKIIADPKKFYSYMLMDDSQNYEDYSIKLSESYSSELDSFNSLTDGFQMHFNTLDSLYLFARELNYSDSEICQLYHYVPLGYVTLKSGFYVQKNSPFQEPFNLKLVAIMERGFNNRYLRNYYEETLVKCSKVKKDYKEDIGFSHVFTAFVILLIGIFIACFSLGLELYYHNIHNKETGNKNP